MAEETQAPEETSAQKFDIRKLYVKDISFESPNAPEAFQGESWEPDIDVQLNSSARKLAEDVFEVSLTVTVTAKIDKDRTAYLAEVQQAGVFVISGFDGKELKYMCGSYCPNIMFPYAGAALSDLITRGGFPQMDLKPVNFDALFQQRMEELEAEAQAADQTKQ